MAPPLRLSRAEYARIMRGGTLRELADRAELAYGRTQAVIAAAAKFCTRWQVEVQATHVRAINAEGSPQEVRAKRKCEDAEVVFLAAREWLRECSHESAKAYKELHDARDRLRAFNDKRAAAQAKKK